MRTRGKGGGPGPDNWASWRRALLLSFVLHALILLLAIGLAAPPRASGPADRGVTLGARPDEAADAPTLVDLASADALVPTADISPSAPVEINLGAVAGDKANAVSAAAIHPVAGATDRSAPAPDRGRGAGRPLPDRAWRRDTSTLHERLTDGAELNQPSHARTARVATSLQAVRREQDTGTGDSARTSRQRLLSPAAEYGLEDPAAKGVGARTFDGAPSLDSKRPPLVATTVPLGAAEPGQGPLDADRGARSFDVPTRGRLAADDHATRAASSESHPSITDLTLAAVPGNTAEGRGPSDTPGAVAVPTQGRAASPSGTRSPVDGMGEEARTRERIYNRYTQEIGARVNDALVWPRALAIRLEQGQTIVRFVVLPDGKVSDNLRVVKSSGFSEFDQAALDAVRKASPFPPMRDLTGARPLPVKLPVTFSNPVIR